MDILTVYFYWLYFCFDLFNCFGQRFFNLLYFLLFLIFLLFSIIIFSITCIIQPFCMCLCICIYRVVSYLRCFIWGVLFCFIYFYTLCCFLFVFVSFTLAFLAFSLSLSFFLLLFFENVFGKLWSQSENCTYLQNRSNQKTPHQLAMKLEEKVRQMTKLKYFAISRGSSLIYKFYNLRVSISS